ncbi:cytochrome P450 [Micromonospora sp. CA-248260]|uniref:cytochrome P450 n=1 Tax=Micromonospora sp. CA-248260 TaxID=3239962 RepID=UPI003D8F16A5
MTETTTTTTASIPLAPGALPLLGHALPLLRDPLAFIRSLAGYPRMVRVRLGPTSAVLICDPTLTRHIFVNDRTFDKGGPIYDRIREVIGDGLSTCPYPLHRRQRRLCQPSFHPQRLHGYAAVFGRASHATAGSWHDGQVLDVTREMMTLTTQATMETMFSGSLPADTLRRALADTNTVVSAFFRRMMTPALLRRLPTPAKRRYDQARSRLFATITEIVAARRADPTDHADLLSALVAAVDVESRDHEQRLSDSELADQALTFFLGGMETTAITLAWALHLLATHPEIQHALQAETDTVLAGTLPGPEHLPRLDLATRVVTETLRLYPPAWMMTRTVAQETELDGVRLRRGDTLVLSPYLIHRRPDLYADPDHFDPDRWRGTSPDRTGYVPFGAGARKCIGDQFALTEAILALTAVAARWELSPVGEEPFRPKVETSLSSRGLRLRLRRRLTEPSGTDAPPVATSQPLPVPSPPGPGPDACPVAH